jgi:Reverse transcriptase (RNA-dependent DNA polymerase)
MAPLNDTYIALIPKKKSAVHTLDYRPINLLNVVQKIFSKILENHIRPLMDMLIQPTQTEFIKERNIVQGFHNA